MHPRKKCTEAWIASAVLVLSLSPSVFGAQDNNWQSGSKKNSLNSGAVLSGSESNSSTAGQDPGDDDTATGIVQESTPEQSGNDSRRLTLVIGQSKTLALPDYAKRVKIDNPNLVDARVNRNNPRELLVTATAIKPGTAQIIVTDRNGGTHRIDVTITQDSGPLQQAIEEMFTDANVRAIPAGEG